MLFDYFRYRCAVPWPTSIRWRRGVRVVSTVIVAVTPGMAWASLHVGAGGVVFLLLVLVAAMLSIPALAALTARPGERVRDMWIWLALWLTFNVTACALPTGAFGGLADRVLFQRFRYLALGFCVALALWRGYQRLRDRRRTGASMDLD